ncbi:membrane protein UL45 [Equid alphaherpesvirus 9]|uniref:Tegument/envelope protein n=1 Tax=Equid alphaherpesvirus 9 TaxID=55744 RepID=B7FEF7_9ALPH|nr:membrane protein UL45 [Equid alphaherpesvirus 9]BAH02440.1 tegument/envelope protein [Equid alphaherpesvirus 9]
MAGDPTAAMEDYKLLELEAAAGDVQAPPLPTKTVPVFAPPLPTPPTPTEFVYTKRRRPKRKARCRCLFFTMGMFALGVLITTAILVSTFILTVPMGALRTAPCPAETFGLGDECVRPVLLNTPTTSNISGMGAVCEEYSEMAAPNDTAGLIMSLLDCLNAGDNEFVMNKLNLNDTQLAYCNVSSFVECSNKGVGVCYAARPLSPLGELIYKARQALRLDHIIPFIRQ